MTVDVEQPAPKETPDALRGLLARISQQDRDAFACFYDQTVERVYALAIRITRQPASAEEVVGDVFLQVWLQAPRYDDTRGSPLAWVMTICRSRALDTLRRARSHDERVEAQSVEVSDMDADDTTQDLLVAADEHGRLHAALSTLDEQQRQLLSLAYFRDYSHRELAAFTGLPVGTVKTSLRRGLAKLREMLKDPSPPTRETLPR